MFSLTLTIPWPWWHAFRVLNFLLYFICYMWMESIKILMDHILEVHGKGSRQSSLKLKNEPGTSSFIKTEPLDEDFGPAPDSFRELSILIILIMNSLSLVLFGLGTNKPGIELLPGEEQLSHTATVLVSACISSLCQATALSFTISFTMYISVQWVRLGEVRFV